MSFSRTFLAIATCAIGSVALAQTNVGTGPTAAVSNQDRRFIDNAVKGGREKVELGRLAMDRGSDPTVKQFGAKMIDDHSSANQQLERIAVDKGVALPAQGQSAEYRKLSSMSGADFDRAYKTEMIRDHEKDVSEFQRESNSTQDPSLRQYVNGTLPTLRSHLDQAKAMKP